MPEPLGEKIFPALDLQDQGFYRNGELEQGVCAAATCHWIAKTIRKGVLKSIDEVGTKFKIELSQAAHEFGNFSDETDEKTREALVEACGLRVISRVVSDTPSDTGTRKKIADEYLSAVPAASDAIYSWVGLRREGGGHAIGVHATKEGQVYLFDANFGLFRYKKEDWAAGFEHLLTKVYTIGAGMKYKLPARITRVTDR